MFSNQADSGRLLTTTRARAYKWSHLFNPASNLPDFYDVKGPYCVSVGIFLSSWVLDSLNGKNPYLGGLIRLYPSSGNNGGPEVIFEDFEE